MMFRKKSLAATLLAAAVLPLSAVACGFHTYIPEETVVDKMLGSDHIVLARAAPEDRFRFEAVSAIRGEVAEADLPFLVDTYTRRRLSANPEHTVLFAREGAYGPWQRLAYLDDDYRALVDHLSTRLDDWELGGDVERYQTFAAYHAHSDDALRQLALQELDWAPYEVLRRLDIDVETDAILSRLYNPVESKLIPIRLLLLGLSDDLDVAPILRDGLYRAADDPPLDYIGAYATALVELDGEAGIATVLEIMNDNARTEMVRESLAEVLAIQALANPRHAPSIEAGVKEALARDPALAGAVARQFGVRADWRFADVFADLMSGKNLNSTGDIITLSQYVVFARQEAAQTAVESQ